MCVFILVVCSYSLFYNTYNYCICCKFYIYCKSFIVAKPIEDISFVIMIIIY
jgi:hypothetical protein